MEFLDGKIFGELEEEKYDLFVVFYRLKNAISLVHDFHRVGLFHRDIKGTNIFTIQDKTYYDNTNMILIDLAFSCWKKFDTRYKGTRKYMPDEQIKPVKKSDWYNNSIDVFSLAVTFIEYLIPAFKMGIEFNLSLFYILESMLQYNKCSFYDTTGIHCMNREEFY